LRTSNLALRHQGMFNTESKNQTKKFAHTLAWRWPDLGASVA
jgi:hypothetical protein